MPRASPALLGGVFLGVALGFCVLTVVVERHERGTFQGALHTTGTVVAILPRHGTRGSVTYAPLVRYRTSSGAQVDFTSSLASSSADYKVGDVVPVVYTPLNPQQAEIDRWWARWLNTVLAGGLAFLFLLLGTFMIVKGARSRARQ